MELTDGLIGPIATIIDTVVADATARDAAKLKLLALQGTPELKRVKAQLCAILAAERSADPWTRRARPSFLYVMYILLLWSIPLGAIAALRPHMATDIARGMSAYLAGIPEPLYALFGTGYLGYTVARSWGKAKGVEK